MSEKVLTCAMDIRSGLKTYNKKPQAVPIDKELLNLARHAHASCKTYLEEKRRQKEKEALEEKEKEERRLAEEELKKTLRTESEKISKKSRWKN